LESIKHYNGRRSTTITADVDQTITTPIEANRKIRKAFAERARKQPGLRMVFGGEEKATQESMRSFYWAFVAAMIGIYFLLIALLNSFLQPLLIMTAIPFGLAGVMFGFWLHSLPLGFLAIVGCLGLIGVVVNDSLVMVTFLNSMRQKKGNRLTFDEIIEGAKTRLRPVMLTTITTVAGLVPTIYGFGGYEPFLVPIVLALASGLIIATIGTLIMIPVVYSYLK
jgi:multidrug efflux pump subunit AcrB